jgi:PAS domain S-box-containing protein
MADVDVPRERGVDEERLFALSLDLLATVRLDGYLSRVNNAWEQTLGWSEEQLLSAPYSDILHPDDVERTMAEAQRLAVEGGETRDFELRCRTATGDYRWVSFNVVAAEGSELLYAVGRDITVRRRAEQYLATQLRVAEVLAAARPEEAAEPLLLAAIGESMDWIYGELWRVSDDDRLRVSAIWEQPGTEHENFVALTREVSFERGIGLPGTVWDRGEPVWVDDVTSGAIFYRGPSAEREGLRTAIGLPVFHRGRVIGVISYFSPDIARPDRELTVMMASIGSRVGEFLRRMEAERELAETAAELEQRNTELARSNADLEQFAYVASHDLSEPLRMVAGFVGLLARRYEGRLDDDADEFIGYAVEGVSRMRLLIDDLLAYSRVGRREQELGAVDTAEVLGRVRRVLEPAIAAAGAEIVVGTLPVVRADETQVGQLFQNLLSNALKFRGSDAPVVHLGAERDGDWWRFSIRDNGIGIEPRHADRIFKVFQRLNAREDYEGTGIGLAICQRIVDRHGGRLWLQGWSDGHRGAEFRFTLPAVGENAPR